MTMRGVSFSPSRILNEERGVFGLYFSDLAGGIGIFIGWSALFDGSGLQLFALPTAILAMMILVPIRLSTRRGIIRDFFGYLISGGKLRAGA